MFFRSLFNIIRGGGVIVNDKLIFYLYYYEDENLFTDNGGHVIYDIFNIITPQDLFLFQYDNGYNIFPMVWNPNTLCEIIPIPDEVCGLQDIPDIDIGDDYERIERYEKARMSGCFNR